MSTIKSSSANLTLNADGSGNDIKFQSNAVEKASLTDAGVFLDINSSNVRSGRRNIVENGAMKVAQRGTSFPAAAGGVQLDRWNFGLSNLGAYTVTQDSDAPAGFANSYKIDCTTAASITTSTDYILVSQRIEGQDLQQLKKGTASAESITVSFWVKSNKAGDIQVNLNDFDNSRLIGNTISVNSNDTWEQKSLTFTGDTTGALDDDNGGSLGLYFWLNAGTNWASGSVPTSWETKDNTDRAAGATFAINDSTSNYFNITGIQLEVGSVATEFEHRSYAEELALCQRYYQRFVSDASYTAFGVVRAADSTNCKGVLTYRTTMRASPTFAQSNTGFNIGPQYTVTSIGTTYAGKDCAWVDLTSSGASLTAGQAVVWNANNNAAAYVELNSEL